MQLTPKMFTVALLALALAGCAKLNAAYINDQPAPFGHLTDSQATSYGQTAFNRFNMMALSIGGSAWSNVNPHSLPPFSANPVLIGSIPALSDDWTVPAANQPAIATIAKLKANGAAVYASVLGSDSGNYLGALSTANLTPNSTVCAAGGSGVGNINCLVFYLDKVLSAYGFDGLDIDIEGGAANGFGNLLSGIGQSSSFQASYGLSFAPYVDNGSWEPGIAVLNGSCLFQDSGLNDYLAARQYYAGGSEYGQTVPAAVSSVLTQAQTFVCSGGSALALDASNYVVGMSPYSVLGAQFPPGRGGPNNCQYDYQRGYPDCAETMAAIVQNHPDIAGSFVWTLGLLDPHYYACYMGNALNGTSNDCGTPQPIPGDTGKNCVVLPDNPEGVCCAPKSQYNSTTGSCTPPGS